MGPESSGGASWSHDEQRLSSRPRRSLPVSGAEAPGGGGSPFFGSCLLSVAGGGQVNFE